MKTVLAIDPGTTESAYVIWNGKAQDFGFLPNAEIVRLMRDGAFAEHDFVAIEMVACYGMPVGKETFEACVWIGRFAERAGRPVRLVYRRDVKIHLCGSMKAKDGNIAQALRDKHGDKGTKANPGPFFGVSKHIWSAIAVADFAFDTLNP